MKKIIIILFLFISIETFVFQTLGEIKERRVNSFLDTRVTLLENNLISTIAAYDQIFDNVVEKDLKRPEVTRLLALAIQEPENRKVYRNKLIRISKPVFDSLKSIGLTHMHFHFPDSISFLRLHNPDMYGDDLSGFRTAVVNANKLHKVIRTFENGRCFAAYRAVYPIYDGDRHVGSVEMSMGFHDILDSLNKLYGNCFSYILEKEAVFKDYSGESVEKYKEISINDDFIMESCDSCSTESGLTCFSIDIENVLISSINQKIKAKLKNYERFSIIADEETSLVLNFFPVKDLGGNGLGYFISHSEEQEIKSLNFFYNALFVLITILIIFIIALFELMDYRRRKTRSLNILLRKKVKNMVKELTEKEQFLSQQSKMATMGEMLNSILHQWKQPVSSVSLICDMLLMEEEKLDKEMVKYIRTIKEQIIFMNDTSDDFRNFLKPSEEKVDFNIADAIEEVINLFEFSFARFSIGFAKSWDAETAEKAYVNGYPNEFKHVMLNLFNNSKDAIIALREKMVEDGQDVSDFSGLITISIKREGDKIYLSVSDTGGGIPQDIIDLVFDNYFSTKGKAGSGIGLFVSRNFVERNMNGKMFVRNILGGCEFCIEFSGTDQNK